MFRLTVTSSEEIWRITDVVHDSWFTLSEIRCVGDAASLVIPFEYHSIHRRRGWRGLRQKSETPRLAYLRVSHMLRWEAHDNCRIDRYDFNEVLYSEDEGLVRITSGFDLAIWVMVSQLDVTIEVTCGPYTNKET